MLKASARNSILMFSLIGVTLRQREVSRSTNLGPNKVFLRKSPSVPKGCSAKAEGLNHVVHTFPTIGLLLNPVTRFGLSPGCPAGLFKFA